jgi:uncharacterized membrane protein
MPYCSQCGAQLAENVVFCTVCGRGVGNSSSARTGGPDFGALTPNVAGLLAYVLGFVTGIFFLVVEPYKRDPFVRFHAYQSIFFSVAYFIASAAFAILTSLFFGLPLAPAGYVIHLTWTFVQLAFLAGWVVLMYKAYTYERFLLPYIGPWAAREAG